MTVAERAIASDTVLPVVTVILRELRIDDWPRVHEWASREEACRYQVWGPNQPEETRRFVTDAVDWSQQPDRQRRVWAAESSAADVVGLGELKIHSLQHGTAEIAYAVHVDLWGNGFGAAIARSLVKIAQDEGMHRIAATCDPRNIASARVLQKIGMQYEGRMRHTLRLADGWRDSDMYALIDGA
jgi:ribosomal-protein-alanine N-acetyltransferase